jgi:hypothetical protein
LRKPSYLLPNDADRRSKDEEPSQFLEELIRRYAQPNKASDKPFLITKPLSFFCEIRQSQGFGPGARFGASFTTVGMKSYVFGGQGSERKNDVKVLDTVSMHWLPMETTGNIPEERFGHSAVAYKHSILVFGGAGDYDTKLRIRTLFARIFMLHTGKTQPVTGRWDTIKPSGSPPDNRRFHSASIVGSTMLIFGGLTADGLLLGDLTAVNLGAGLAENACWFTPQMRSGSKGPSARYGATLTACFSESTLKQTQFDCFNLPKFSGEIFTANTSGLLLFGGQDSAGSALNELWILRLPKAANRKLSVVSPHFSWERLRPAGITPKGRYGHTSVLVQGYLIVAGGRNDQMYQSERVIHLDEIIAYNIQTCRWEEINLAGTPPIGRWGACAELVGSKLIIFGGMELSNYCNSDICSIETNQEVVEDLLAGDDLKLKLDRALNRREIIQRKVRKLMAKPSTKLLLKRFF